MTVIGPNDEEVVTTGYDGVPAEREEENDPDAAVSAPEMETVGAATLVVNEPVAAVRAPVENVVLTIVAASRVPGILTTPVPKFSRVILELAF